MSKKMLDLFHAENVIDTVARRNGKPVAEIRMEIQQAIMEAMDYSDPAVRALWEAIPRKGDVPTPEEFIVWAELQVRQGNERSGCSVYCQI